MTRRTLILIHRGRDYVRDFEEIAAKVRALDAGIAVHAVSAGFAGELPGEAWQHPALTVALCSTFALTVRRGPVFRNHQIAKLVQHQLFWRGGIPVPPMLPFEFGMMLDPLLFGEFVVVKPRHLDQTSSGSGIMLFRRRRLERLRRQDLAPGHPLRSTPGGLLVQRYVHTGAFVGYNRVSTFFAQPLYAITTRAAVQKIDLAADDAAIEAADITNVRDEGRLQIFAAEPDVLALARRVHELLPELPLLGIDILREERSGRLYVLEANPGGNSWHFSSANGRDWREKIGRDASDDPAVAARIARERMMAQFGAFDVVAAALVEKTLRFAA